MILTIITPTLNCNQTIIDTLNSVIAVENKFSGQIEYFIGDGGSNDGTIQIIECYCKVHSFIKLFDLHGINIPETLNQLIRISSGKYLMILNGDDYILPGSFTSVLSGLKDKNFHGIFCGSIKVATEDSILIGRRGVSYKKINNFMSVNHPAMIVHKSVFTTIGDFNIESPNSYDYCWTWTAFKNHLTFKLEDTSIALMRLGGISQTRARLAAREIYIYKVKLGNPLNASINYTFFYIKFLLKTMLPTYFLSYITKAYRKIIKSIDHY